MMKGLNENAGQRMGEVFAYTGFYLLVFSLLEQRSTNYTILGSELDRLIPFIPAFIIPYLLWFVYVALTVAWFTLWGSDSSYYRLSRSLALGCTVFLMISVLCPNGQHLRPVIYSTSTGCEALVRLLYLADTPTNVFPSIHVFNSAVCCEAILRERSFPKKRLLDIAAIALTLLIIAATVFLKQHTLADVVGGLVLYLICHALFYRRCANHPTVLHYHLRSRSARKNTAHI